jgi:hypothetical protein
MVLCESCERYYDDSLEYCLYCGAENPEISKKLFMEEVADAEDDPNDPDDK